MKYLLDTSIIIDFIRRQDKEKTIFYRLTKKKHKLFISIITHTELYSGSSVWEKPEAAAAIDQLLSNLTILPLTKTISKNTGHLIYQYKFRNEERIDALIAATAITHKLPLATLNRKHFSKIPSLKLLS